MARFGRGQADATVTAMAWSRTVELEVLVWVPKRSSWVPSDDVRNVQKHTESYWATVTDSQPGAPDSTGIPGPTVSSVRSELRTRVYYTFEAHQWRRGQKAAASGSGPQDVHWPDTPLGPGERVMSRHESYTLTLAADGKQHEASLPEGEWRGFTAGD